MISTQDRPSIAPAAKRIGLHLPAPRGIEEVLSLGAQQGCGVVQVFGSNPRSWAPSRLAPDRAERVRAQREVLDVELVLHAPYLINLASPRPEIASRSVEAVRATLAQAGQLGARSVVVHTGSHTGAPRSFALAQTAAAVHELLGDIEDDIDGPDLLLELTAGGGTPVAARFEHAVELMDVIGVHPRLGLCLDTCHLHAAGHDLSSITAVGRTLDLAQRLLGTLVRLVHLNDTADALGSHRDRHARPGEGLLGIDALAAVLAHPIMRRANAVLETPGDKVDRFADAARIRHAYASTLRSQTPVSTSSVPTSLTPALCAPTLSAHAREKASGNDPSPLARRVPVHS